MKNPVKNIDSRKLYVLYSIYDYSYPAVQILWTSLIKNM